MSMTTLQQSLKLRELGAPQDTDFAWDHGELVYKKITWPAYKPEELEDIVAAYDLESLIEWIVGDKRNSFYLQYDDEWSVYEGEPQKDFKWHARYYPNTPVGFYDETGANPLDAVFNLCEALKGKL